jgi:hypothetical protein
MTEKFSGIPEVITENTADMEAVLAEIATLRPSRSDRIFEKFVVAALGSIPWVGGLLAAIAAMPGEEAQDQGDDLRTKWLQAGL